MQPVRYTLPRGCGGRGKPRRFSAQQESAQQLTNEGADVWWSEHGIAWGVYNIMIHHTPETIPSPPSILAHHVLDNGYKFGLPWTLIGRLALEHISHVFECGRYIVHLMLHRLVHTPQIVCVAPVVVQT